MFNIYIYVYIYIYIYNLYIYSNAHPLLLSVGVCSRLYLGSWVEIMGVLFSLIGDSKIPKKSKSNFFSVRMVENSAKWRGREEIFK